MVRLPQSPEGIGKAGSAYEQLRRMAINGELRPDRRLSPNDLIEMSSASITPIREALMRLASEGLIHAEVNRGYFTKRFEASEQSDLLDILIMNLRSGLDWSLRREPSVFVQHLAGLGVADAEDAESLTSLIEHFHADLAQTSGNRPFAWISRMMIDRTHMIRLLDFEDPEIAAIARSALRDTARAILARNAPEAIDSALPALHSRLDRLPDLIDRANAKAARSRFP